MRTRCTTFVRTLASLGVLLLAVALPAHALPGDLGPAGPATAAGLLAHPPEAQDIVDTYIDDDWTGLPPGTPVFFPGDPVTHTIGVDAFATIQEGVDGLTITGTVHVADGVYTGTLNIVARTSIQVVGLDRDTVVVRPDDTLCWNVGGYGCSRRAAFRVVDSPGIAFHNSTFDFADVAGNNNIGFLYWDSTGALEGNVLENMSLPDLSGYYYEVTSYFRAPAYTDTLRAEIVIRNNLFTDTGRLGLVTHDFVHATIEDNTFFKVFDDFGYAMEIGSRSTAVISGNVIYGYDTPAASDGSASAGIYVENAFTGGLPHVTKTVTIRNNDIHSNQYGLYIGNEWDGFAGDVDIVVLLEETGVHDNVEGGIVVADEDRSAGSSVTLQANRNALTNNGAVGCYFFTYGDGELHTILAENSIVGHDIGILVENWGGAGSLYDLAAHHNRIVDNGIGVSSTITATFAAADNWWGCNDGPGAAGCDPIFGPVGYDPWIVLGLSAVPDVIALYTTADLTADLTWNSVPTDTSPWGHVPDGIEASFATTMGTVSPTVSATQAGMATSTFAAEHLPGPAVVSATVDHQTVTTTVTIIEPVVQFSSASYSVDEAAGLAVITVTANPAPGRFAQVGYTSGGGTATPGSDYTPVSGWLDFGPGEDTLTFTVPILDDTLDELDETVALSLTGAASATLGTPYTATLTLLDDDPLPLVRFDRADHQVNESAGSATITVTLSAPSSFTVTVAYAAYDGTATPGDDYTPVSGTLTFAPGQDTLTFTVPILDDTLDEPAETIALSLSNPINAELGTPYTATLAIVDDDLLFTIYVPLVFRAFAP